MKIKLSLHRHRVRLLKIIVPSSEETDGLDKLLNFEATAEAKMSKFDENIHTSRSFISLPREKLRKIFQNL